MQIPAHKIKFLASVLLILGCTLDPTNSFDVGTNTTYDLGEFPQSTRIVSADIDALTKTTITLNMDVTTKLFKLTSIKVLSKTGAACDPGLFTVSAEE